ncbi:MAG: hypothetical protein DRP15_03405, partial [Candidatus Aenigmatarchaeota archaeon]
ERIERLKNSHIIEELEKIYNQSLDLVSPFEMTGTLKGRSTIDKQLQSMFKSAKESIDIVTTEQGLRNLYETHFRTLKKMSKNGVKIRIAAPFTDKEIFDAFSNIAEVKKIDSPLGRIIRVDNEHVFMGLTDDSEVHETQDMVFWARSPHVASSVVEPIFRQIWSEKGVGE